MYIFSLVVPCNNMSGPAIQQRLSTAALDEVVVICWEGELPEVAKIRTQMNCYNWTEKGVGIDRK